MAKSTALNLPQNGNNSGVTLTSADTIIPVTLFTAGSNDSNCNSIIVVTDDTSDVGVQLYLRHGGVDYLLGTVNVATGSGTNGNPSVDLLEQDLAVNSTRITGLPVDNVGKPFIPLENGDTLKVGCLATMTVLKTTTVVAFGEDY